MRILFALVMLVLLPASALRAQDAQVPLDEEGHVPFVDQKLEKKLQLFQEYEGFKEARLFRSSDGRYDLVILHQPGKELLQVRIALTEEQVADWRAMVSAGINEVAPELAIDQEGRTRWLVGTSIIGQYHAIAIPVITEMNDARAIVGVTMLTSGTVILVPIFATRNTRMTVADASLSLYGQSRGIAHGVLLGYLFGGENLDGRAAIGLGMVGNVAEGLGGYFWADRTQMSGGTAAAIGAIGDFGALAGGGIAATVIEDIGIRGVSAGLLLGSAAGLGTARILDNNKVYTRGDAVMLRGAGFLGAAVPGAILVLAETQNDRAIFGALTAGMMGGVVAGHALARKYDYTIGQGTLINLGAIGSGLFMAGLGFLVTPDNSELDKVTVSLGTLGALSGFAVMTRVYADKASVEPFGQNLDIGLNPYGLLGLLSKDGQRTQFNYNQPDQWTAPILHASLRF